MCVLCLREAQQPQLEVQPWGSPPYPALPSHPTAVAAPLEHLPAHELCPALLLGDNTCRSVLHFHQKS